MEPKMPSMPCALLAMLLLVAAAAGASHHHAAAPAPAVDCSNLVLNMADCLSFVTNGSATTVPEKTCCDGLKTVLKTSPECLCEAFKSSAQLGVVLNVTKALSLPSACKTHAPPASNCGLSLANGAPATSPSVAAVPTAGVGGNENIPATAPGASSGSPGLSIPLIRSLILGLFLVAMPLFLME